MNFKKLAEQKIDELSGKIPVKVIDNDSIDLVIACLTSVADTPVPETGSCTVTFVASKLMPASTRPDDN